MTTVKQVKEMVKTLDVINSYEETYGGIKSLKKAIINLNATDAETLYFQILAKVLNEKSSLLPDNIKYLPIEALNAAMHYLHLEHGDVIRGRAIREVGEYDANVLFSQYNVSLGAFPEELEKVMGEIFNAAKNYTDIHMEKATTWKNSHDNWGVTYYYKQNEFPCLRIRSVSQEERTKLLDELIDICERHEEPIIVTLFGPNPPEKIIL